MKIYIINDSAPALEDKSFEEMTDDEIKDMYDAGSPYVSCYESVESLARDWNADALCYPDFSWMRVIND